MEVMIIGVRDLGLIDRGLMIQGEMDGGCLVFNDC